MPEGGEADAEATPAAEEPQSGGEPKGEPKPASTKEEPAKKAEPASKPAPAPEKEPEKRAESPKPPFPAPAVRSDLQLLLGAMHVVPLILLPIFVHGYVLSHGSLVKIALMTSSNSCPVRLQSAAKGPKPER